MLLAILIIVFINIIYFLTGMKYHPIESFLQFALEVAESINCGK